MTAMGSINALMPGGRLCTVASCKADLVADMMPAMPHVPNDPIALRSTRVVVKPINIKIPTRAASRTCHGGVIRGSHADYALCSRCAPDAQPDSFAHTRPTRRCSLLRGPRTCVPRKAGCCVCTGKCCRGQHCDQAYFRVRSFEV